MNSLNTYYTYCSTSYNILVVIKTKVLLVVKNKYQVYLIIYGFQYNMNTYYTAFHHILI